MRVGNHESLVNACKEVVRFKDRLDEQGRLQKYAPSVVGWAWAVSGIQARAGAEWTAITPSAFVEHCLPFSCPHISEEGDVRTIDPRLVISGSYRAYGPEPSLLGWSDAAAVKNQRGDNAVPRYVQIGQLPLYVAIEGKNRVSALKQQGHTSMKAVVSDTVYPSPRELELVPLRPFGQYALRHRGFSVVLPFAEPMVSLLTAYGVSVVQAEPGVLAPLAARNTRLRVCARQMLP